MIKLKIKNHGLVCSQIALISLLAFSCALERSEESGSKIDASEAEIVTDSEVQLDAIPMRHFTFGDAEFLSGPGIRVFQDGKLLDFSDHSLILQTRFLDTSKDILPETLMRDLVYSPTAAKDYTCDALKLDDVIRFSSEDCPKAESQIHSLILELRTRIDLSRPWAVIDVGTSDIESALNRLVDPDALAPVLTKDSRNVEKRIRSEIKDFDLEIESLETVVIQVLDKDQTSGKSSEREIKLSCFRAADKLDSKQLEWNGDCQKSFGEFVKMEIKLDRP